MATQTEDTKPTEEQVKDANAKEMARWEDDFPKDQLQVKYDKDEEESGGEEEKPKDDKKQDKKTDAKEKEDLEEEFVEVFDEPDPVVTAEDPGEYKPQDYSFKIDIKGKSYTVDSADKAAELAETHAEDLSAGQLVKLVNQGSQIDIKQSRDKDKHDEAKKKFDEQNQLATERMETVENIASEFEYLEGKGLLPKVAPEFRDADWNDPHVAKQPGVKEQIELLSYMVKENKARAKAGVKPLSSAVDAYNSWQLDQDRKTKEKEQKEDGERRKSAGARVAGVSTAPAGSYVPKGIAVGNPNVLKRNSAMWD